MALAVLSPWPSTPAALAAARACLKGEVGSDLTDERADQLGMVASALVEREAPRAPQAIRNEATIRAAGYLRQSDYGGIRSEEIGPRKVEYMTNSGMAFRHSGAKALLSPWKIRRAGAISA